MRCRNAAAAADTGAAPTSGWTFFPGLDSPGGDICQALSPQDTSSGMATTMYPEAASSSSASASASSSGPSGTSITINSSHSLALMALAKPFCVAFNTNGWLKALLQPMHGWVKWTAEAGKGLFVRNDVLYALMQGVLAHVQGEAVCDCAWGL